MLKFFFVLKAFFMKSILFNQLHFEETLALFEILRKERNKYMGFRVYLTHDSNRLSASDAAFSVKFLYKKHQILDPVSCLPEISSSSVELDSQNDFCFCVHLYIFIIILSSGLLAFPCKFIV